MLQGLDGLFDLPILDVWTLGGFFQKTQNIGGGAGDQRAFHGFGETLGLFDEPGCLSGVDFQAGKFLVK